MQVTKTIKTNAFDFNPNLNQRYVASVLRSNKYNIDAGLVFANNRPLAYASINIQFFVEYTSSKNRKCVAEIYYDWSISDWCYRIRGGAFTNTGKVCYGGVDNAKKAVQRLLAAEIGYRPHTVILAYS